MSNRILINATHLNEELRVAVVNDNMVNQLDIEAIAKQQTKAFIYKGKISRIEPSLEACFVDYGEQRHGFLPLKDVCPHYFTKPVADGEKPSIKDVLKEGQELIVQVEKIERGNKGAALTTNITLAGSYLVLMPNNTRAGGVSRRIEGEERQALTDILKKLETPKEMGIIVRTASVGKSLEELQWDLDILVRLWDCIQQIANNNPAPFLIHQESNAMIRALRDYLRQNTDEIIIDREDIFHKAKKYIEQIRPDFADKVKHHQHSKPIFNYYNIENQVESVFQHQLRLPSGGSLVIDQTEALVAIDINSAKATKGSDIEETAFATNIESAKEIARQLRLRDVGGLIVIDFIDMMKSSHQQEVEECLRNALKSDRAKVQVGRISRFGLLEMSRQRLRSTLAESTRMHCPRCQGQGMIRSTTSLSLSIIRAIVEEGLKEGVGLVRAHLPTEIATYLLNEKRNYISEAEQTYGIRIHLIPHVHLEAPHYELEAVKGSAAGGKASYKLAVEFKQGHENTNYAEMGLDDDSRRHQPALQTIDIPNQPSSSGRPPRRKPASKKKGLLARLFGFLFGSDEKEDKKPHHHRRRHRHHNKSGGGRRHHHKRQGQGNRQGGSGGNNRPRRSGNSSGNSNNRGNNNNSGNIAQRNKKQAS